MALRGPHNYDNACAAAALAIAAGIDDAAIAAGICGFKGLQHRLEYVDELPCQILHLRFQGQPRPNRYYAP